MIDIVITAVAVLSATSAVLLGFLAGMAYQNEKNRHQEGADVASASN